MAAKLILVGVGGFGEHHLRNIRRLVEQGDINPIALVDPIVKAKAAADPSFIAPDDAPLFDTLAEALEAVGKADIVIVSVPIHLHAPITKEALRAGADVLLEKPPFSRMTDFDEVLQLEKETGRVVQVGFQSLGSKALDAFASGEIDIGNIKSVRAMGTWLRRDWYWHRSPWVGKRTIGEIEAMDGVGTNALAHAVVTALHIAGIQEAEQVSQIEMEMYRANPVDVDDTSTFRISPTSGPKVLAALTLCASEQTKPIVEVVGERGIASFGYVDDDVTINGVVTHYDRINLLENLVQHRRDGAPLRVPLTATGGFMRFLEQVRTGDQPVHIQRKYIDKQEEGSEAHPVVQDIEKWIRKAADHDALFSEVGAPWAFAKKDSKLAEGVLEGKTILEVLDGNGTTPTSTPRPYIHPVRSLSGVILTATHPADHDWHCGLGFAVPDVDGVSFWGGGTYVHGQGYVNLDNHGTMRSESIEYLPASSSSPTGFDQTIAWIDLEGRTVIREVRSLRWTPLSGSSNGYELSYRSSLTALDKAVSLGSPGSNGRKDGGYGGFFWRLPRCTDISILSADKEGEDSVHGSISPWMAWSANFQARPGSCGPATLVLVPEEDSKRDPWVVRSAGYPGVGSAVAWDKRTEIGKNETISRSFRIGMVDARLDREGVEGVVKALGKRAVEGKSV